MMMMMMVVTDLLVQLLVLAGGLAESVPGLLELHRAL
jgi:hypothetical protein